MLLSFIPLITNKIDKLKKNKYKFSLSGCVEQITRFGCIIKIKDRINDVFMLLKSLSAIRNPTTGIIVPLNNEMLLAVTSIENPYLANSFIKYIGRGGTTL